MYNFQLRECSLEALKIVIGQPARILTPDWCRYSIVSKKWRMIAQDSRLWAMVSLRPEISGLMIPNMEMLLKLIQNRCRVSS